MTKFRRFIFSFVFVFVLFFVHGGFGSRLLVSPAVTNKGQPGYNKTGSPLMSLCVFCSEPGQLLSSAVPTFTRTSDGGANGGQRVRGARWARGVVGVVLGVVAGGGRCSAGDGESVVCIPQQQLHKL